MSLSANFRRDAFGNITIFLKGRLDYENSTTFKTELSSLLRINPSTIITIDMQGLDFIGSSGIGYYFNTIQSLNATKMQIHLTNVKTEFIKVFKLYDEKLANIKIQTTDTDAAPEVQIKRSAEIG